MKSTQVGGAQEALKAQERQNQSVAQETFQRYNQTYTKAMAALTGENYPLVLTVCENAKAGTQEACMDDIRRNMQGLLMGNDTASQMVMSIKASQPKNLISFKCQGLNGCIRTLQNIHTNLKKEVVSLKAFKRDYVTKANQSIEQFTQRMAQTLSPQNQMLEQQIRNLNSTLAGLGVKGTISPKGVEAEQFEKDGEPSGENDTDNGGLFKMPKSLSNLIGGKMSPPMLDVSKDSFKDALSGVADAVSKLDDQKTKIADALTKVDALASSCSQQELEKAIGSLEKEVERFNSCMGSENWCDTNGSSLDQLVNSLQAASISGLEGVQGTLESGQINCQGEKSSSANCVGVSGAISKFNDVKRINSRIQKASGAASAL
jgi:hypothetical protein